MNNRGIQTVFLDRQTTIKLDFVDLEALTHCFKTNKNNYFK